ncbi:MAG TPA: ABC transporter [Bdellovibrionales bacterium]|nr:ABC transporter [Bdellovibrionales bacterium]
MVMIKTKQEGADKKPGLTNSALIERYTDQASELPSSLRKELNGRGYVLLFAYADLNMNFQLQGSWLILLDQGLVLAHANQNEEWNLKQVPLSEISKTEERQALSCNTLKVLGSEGQIHFVVRYSHRQSRCMALLRTYLEEILSGKESTQRLSKDADEIYRDQVLMPVKEAQASITGNQLSVVWRLLGYLKPFKAQVILGMGAAILMTGVSLIPAYLTGYIIDQVIQPFEGGVLQKESALRLMWFAIAGLVSTYLFREFFGWIRLRTMSVLGEYVARDLRDQVYSHLHKLSLSFFSSKQTGSLISRVGSDTDRIWDFVAFGVVEVTTSIMMLVGLSSVLMYLDWKLGLVVTLPVPVLLFAIYWHGEHMQSLFIRAWRKWSDLTDCLSDTIPGIRVVKAFHRQDYETEKFQSRNAAVVSEFTQIHQAWTSFWPGLMLSIQVIVITVWMIGVPRVIEGSLTAGVFVSFTLYLTMFTQPLEIIGQMARMINRATSSAHRVFEVLDTEPQITEIQNPIEISNLKGCVEFKNVSFSYDGVRKVIKNLSFSVKPGEMIGLVGPSGGGKTTITNLIARFFEANQGQILIDGIDVKDLDLGSFRKQIGLVLQEPYLFHGTLLENIRYAKPEATLEEVVAAARAANAHDFICKLPNAYDTIVGERGQTLSGGERQRVSIARAILSNPPLLILDEATSAVDTETERKIQEALDRLVSGRTVFAIAHRLSTLATADRIFVIKEGELIEEGPHKHLVQVQKGVYKNLVDMQNQLAYLS